MNTSDKIKNKKVGGAGFMVQGMILTSKFISQHHALYPKYQGLVPDNLETFKFNNKSKSNIQAKLSNFLK